MFCPPEGSRVYWEKLVQFYTFFCYTLIKNHLFYWVKTKNKDKLVLYPNDLFFKYIFLSAFPFTTQFTFTRIIEKHFKRSCKSISLPYFLKAFFHKFYLVHSWIPWPVCLNLFSCITCFTFFFLEEIYKFYRFISPKNSQQMCTQHHRSKKSLQRAQCRSFLHVNSVMIFKYKQFLKLGVS